MSPRLCVLSACLALPFSTALAQAGTGLTGQYYDDSDFTTLVTTRVDAAVDFSWGSGFPAGTGITSGNTFSVAWSGQIEPEFTGLYTFYVTADDGARLWVNDMMVTMRTFAASPQEMRGQMRLNAGQRVNLRLEYMEQTGDAAVKLEWSCAARVREVIPTARLYPARVGKAGGSLLREHWSGIAGTAISSLTSNVNYPNKPSGREFITSFECLAQDWADSFGTRVTGFIVPPVTGNYVFAVSGDDKVQLRLSTDESEANKTLIASVSSPTAFRAWGTPSAARTLVQGRRYYVELLHKEDTGADHWSVGWMRQGDSAFSVIPGSALVQAGLERTQPAEANMLDTMSQEHPRLFATAERFARLKAAYLSPIGSTQKTWAQTAIIRADKALTQELLPYRQGGDIRNDMAQRIHTLALAWHLTGDSAYAERAWRELENVADNTAWPDWHFPNGEFDNPNSEGKWLDLGEMTLSCGIGYDWLYHYWTPARRTTIRTAIINKGLNIAKPLYANGDGWTNGTNNWNGVCNGGMTIGALAVGTESEALVEKILKGALDSSRPVWKRYTADNGGWFEGPGYWDYYTTNAMRMAAALENGLGSDFRLSATQAASEVGYSQILPFGTAKKTFNFSDCPVRDETYSPVFQWMARRYNLPIYNGWENAGDGKNLRCWSALNALWWSEGSVTAGSSGVQPDAAFVGDVGTGYIQMGLAALRGRWNDNRASYVASKGGNVIEPHAHSDVGSFVMDALGKRWFHDLGADDYDLPGYGDTERDRLNGVEHWDYYRLRLEGHNTLAIDPNWSAGVDKNGVAPLIAFQSEPGGSGSFYIHDLTPVHLNMQKVWRGVRLLGKRDEMLVQDEIQASSGKTVWWFAHYTVPDTTVVIEPGGTSVMLTQGAERLWCKIVGGGGTFTIRDAVPLPNSPNPQTTPQQDPNTGFKKLAIKLNNVTNTTLAVWFVPLSPGEAAPMTPPTITPLNTWSLITTNDAPTANDGGAGLNGENAVDIDLRGFVTDDGSQAEHMRFSVSNPVNGTVVLLADGYTARFTPAPGYTGVPVFSYTVTDTEPLPNTLLVYDFEPPDATASTEVMDASGAGRTGSIQVIGTGAATLSTEVPAALARSGRSLDLAENGGANAARLSRTITPAELDWNTSVWTISGWFKRRDTGSEDMIWHLGTGGGMGEGGEELYLMASGASTLALQHYPGPDVSITTTAATPGVWHHFAVVRSGTSLRLYLNGTLVGTDNAFTLNLSQSSPLLFGGHTDTTATYAPRWFDGSLDELQVVGSALSVAQITTLASGMTARHLGGLSASATITLSATPVSYNWVNSAAGDWSTAINWQGGTPPVSGRGTTVQFFEGQTLTTGVTAVPNNNLPGTTDINGLVLAGTSTSNTSGSVTVNSTGGALRLVHNGFTFPSVSLSGGSGMTHNVSHPLTLESDTTFFGSGGGRFVFLGDITGPGGLLRTETTSTLILAGTNSYQGPTSIAAGSTLQIGDDGATGSLGTGEVVNQGTLRFDRTGTLAVPNLISGGGGLLIECPAGAGTVELSGINDFTGDVEVKSGALRIRGIGALGDGEKLVTLSSGTTLNPQLRLDGSAADIDLPASISYLTSNDTTGAGAIINDAGNNILRGPITLASGDTTRIQASGGTLTLTGGITPGANNRTLRLAGTAQGLISGVIANAAGTFNINVTKSDSGTWMLSGANRYSGTTTIAAGTLVLGDASALGHGGLTLSSTTGGTSISSGGTLDLNGQGGINEVITARGTGSSSQGCLINSNPSAPASLAAGVVSSITVTAGGTHSAVPTVNLGGNATATATLGVSTASFTIDGGTTVYSKAPDVTISGGGGTGATATVVLASGSVTGITVTNAGGGFISAPGITFSGGKVTTAGTNPTGTGNADNFTVSGITVTNPGSGYTSAPTVSFSTGTGTAATANLSGVILTAASSIGGAGDLTLACDISGSNALTKVGAGTLTLIGANTYTGITTVSEGRIILQGTQSGHLQTSGGGTLAPQGSPAATGNLTQQTGSTLQLRIQNSSSDQLTVNKCTIAGTLELLCAPDILPGSTFTLIHNTSTAATSGTFTGLPQNAEFFEDSQWWRISYTGGTGNDVVLTRITPTAWQTWLGTHFGNNANNPLIAGELADDDKDGTSNLLEYATATSPGISTAVPHMITMNGPNLEYTYTKNKTATDVSYVVDWSDTLTGSWSIVGVTSSVLSDNGTTQQIRAALPTGASGRRFVRLRITRP